MNVVPSCIYSSPEIAVVGLTEAEAKEQAKTVVAVPGYSEHNTGYAADILTDSYRVMDSGFAQRMEGIKRGVDRRFTVISKLRDPDSYGAERVALYDVSFDDLTLADWQAAAVGSVTAPFTFSDYEYLDQIEVQ